MAARVIDRILHHLGVRNAARGNGVVYERDANWYDSLYASSNAYRRHYTQSGYYFLWAVISDRMRRDGLRKILEIGCGPGQFASFLVEGGIDSYAGLDFSPRAVVAARERVPSGRFEVGDARTTDIHARIEHDVVVCTEVLEHIEDDLAVVARFLPGKRCICSVPNFDHESHVRRFLDAEEVAERYGRLFHDMDVATFRSSNYIDDKFFLFDGIRNERHLTDR